MRVLLAWLPALVGAAVLLLIARFWPVPPLVTGAGVAALVVASLWRLPRAARVLAIDRPRGARTGWPDTGMKVMADALPEPCVIADPRGRVRYMNKVAVERLGNVRPGDPLSFRLRAPAFLEALDRVICSGRAERIGWSERVPTERWLEAHVLPLMTPSATARPATDRAPDFLLVLVRDLTEQRRLDTMRSDFVANASHELRTPLAALTGFIETLQGPARDDAVARTRFLGIMQDQARRMKRLIDDLLSLSRIEMRAHLVPRDRVDLGEVACTAIATLDGLARDLGVAVEVEIAPDPVVVIGDRDELVQVAQNLVENALKYGAAGKRVMVRVAPAERGAVLAVRDFGPGIPAEHLPRLTERFYRVDAAQSRAQQGTGLGLAIVKHILARHRGRLAIESRQGEGALFSARFETRAGPEDVT
ncbi:ATP-binding protein [Segnochrobactraceae bacterium EtOH-i3]